MSHYFQNTQEYKNKYIYIYIYISWLIVVEGYLKAPFPIATTPKR